MRVPNPGNKKLMIKMIKPMDDSTFGVLSSRRPIVIVVFFVEE